jgi:hypothetical protein
MFTGLYETELYKSLEDENKVDANDPDAVKKNKADAYVKGLELEYGWSHRICNQVKNNVHFISFKKGANAFFVDQGPITNFLNDIANSKDGEILLNHLGGETRDVRLGKLLGRVKAIEARCKAILDRIPKQNITPIELAQASALYLQELVSMDPECSENVPNTRPTVEKSDEIPSTPIAELVEFAKKDSEYNWIPEAFTGIFAVINKQVSDRSVVSKASDRAIVRSKLVDVQTEFKRVIYENIESGAYVLQRRFFRYLTKTNEAPREISRKYNAIFPQVFHGYVLWLISTLTNELKDAIEKVYKTPHVPRLDEYSDPIKKLVTDELLASEYRAFEVKFTKTYDTENVTLDELMKEEPMTGPLPKYVRAGRRRTNRRKTYRK